MGKEYTIVLAGNANVGKSAIFNELTGLNQTVGNWPGKTVERAEGKLYRKGCSIRLLDLPGIYSLSTFSMEELISREYIATERPDIVINVVDAFALERNLFFTLQLIELGRPMVIALNQTDLADSRGIRIYEKKLSKILGIPVIPTVATKGMGLTELVDTAIRVIKKGQKPIRIRYGKEVEGRIGKLTRMLNKRPGEYPARWLAIKLLEGDKEAEKLADEGTKKMARKFREELERMHGERASIVMTSERYSIAQRITDEVQEVRKVKRSRGEMLDKVTLHRVFGYPILAIAVLLMFTTIFATGDFLTELVESALEGLGYSALEGTLLGGIADGIVAVLTIVIPYLLPFFIILAFLQDSGYLARAAFLMDNTMHKIGLHGKAFIPLILGYGCSVPACMGCRIMETYRERFLAAFVTTMIPCAARTVIILGLVGTYVGIDWALGIYLLNILIVFLLGRAAYKLLPGEPVGLIMEMPPYRWPKLKIILKQAWARMKDYSIVAIPYIIGGSILIAGLRIAGLLEPISQLLSPITVWWLGLPAVTGITLIFGVIRKELALIMLGTLIGTTNFALVLTPVQMIVFTLVSIFYIPCVATIAALKREFGIKRTLYVTVFEIGFAIILGGLALRVLQAAGIP